ncbi:hypothetical protein PVAP13_8KG365404 [Panicum virgatum]|uniref:Uncharacterized protein n=1 Tax=Panicum virgatum TaxID=38727 RepID=A0A8T0PTB9_PANVG|nr:hypothetical protein PVAP13_8KG365404 [Panicum virgatum]
MASFSEGIQLRRCLSFSGGAMQPSPPHKSTGPFNQRQTQLLGAKTVVIARWNLHLRIWEIGTTWTFLSWSSSCYSANHSTLE